MQWKSNVSLDLIIFLLLIIFNIVGCKDPVFDERFYSKDITQNDLIGYWIISADSSRLLRDVCGYMLYTNRSDHVFVLNSNNTCVFRGFDLYVTQNLKLTWEKNERLYNTFFEEQFTNQGAYLGDFPKKQFNELMKQKKIEDEIRRTWYYWNSKGQDIISGPFATNHSEHAIGSGGVYLKNRWSQWRLGVAKDSEPFTQECDDSNSKFKYKLWFGVKGQHDGAIYRHIGLTTNGLLTIWAPIMTTYDGAALNSCGSIRFVKVTKEELVRIVHMEYGVDNGQEKIRITSSQITNEVSGSNEIVGGRSNNSSDGK